MRIFCPSCESDNIGFELTNDDRIIADFLMDDIITTNALCVDCDTEFQLFYQPIKKSITAENK